MVWEKLTRIYVTGGNRRRTTTGAAAPKSWRQAEFWREARPGVFLVEQRPGRLARFLSGRDPRPVNVGVVARAAVDDAPRLGVDDTVGNAAFLLEAFRENGDLNASVGERGVILNK